MDKMELIKAILDCGAVTQKSSELPFGIGESWFFRTVTHHHTGRIKRIVGKFIILEDAAWIADDGRFMGAIESGNLNEVEPITGEFVINSDTIIDATKWRHELPRSQK